MVKGPYRNPIIVGNALGYIKRPNREDVFDRHQFSEAIGDIIDFAIMAKEGHIDRDFVYNFDNNQFSIIVDKLADLVNVGLDWRINNKMRGRQSRKPSAGNKIIIAEAGLEIKLIYAYIKIYVGLHTDSRKKYDENERISDTMATALCCYEENKSFFHHVKRGFLEDKKLYSWNKPRRDFFQYLLLKIQEKQGWKPKSSGKILYETMNQQLNPLYDQIE